MADLNLVNGYLAEGQRDFICSNSSSMDELQLAALLGKTLLEQNSELDTKLRKLQEFAEETLVHNQSLTRQLSESRDSLQFSNKSCVQLEGKVEELERINSHLQRQLLTQHSTLDHRTQQVESLEDEVLELRLQNERLEERTSQLVAEKNDAKENSPNGENRTRERSKSCYSNPMETEGIVAELTVRVQKLTFQKEKAERTLTTVLSENELLARNLERAEMEIEELGHRVTVFEDSVDGQTTPLSTPKSTHSTQHTAFTLPSIPEDQTLQPALATEERSQDSGLSLFNELDTEISTLRHNYNTLVQGCTCSASLHHKVSSRGGVAFGGVVNGGAEAESRPYKEMFAEVFATLKQSAQVADRLIERRKGRNDD